MDMSSKTQMQGPIFIDDPTKHLVYGNTSASINVYDDDVWIGDIPPEKRVQRGVLIESPALYPAVVVKPSGWVEPNGATIHPTITSSSYVDPWKVVIEGHWLTASIDVPGCVIDGLWLSIKDGYLELLSRRRSDFEWRCHRTFIGDDYDASTADAMLEDGVLTVRVMHRHEAPVNVPIVKK